MIEQCGVTQDGRPVYRGLFRFRETYGLPLDLICMEIHRRGGQVGWPSLLEEMRAAGVSDPVAQIVEAARSVGQGDAVERGLGAYEEARHGEIQV